MRPFARLSAADAHYIIHARCKDCVFGQFYSEDQKWGECVRNAPGPVFRGYRKVYEPQDRANFEWPMVQAHQRCGEYVRLTPYDGPFPDAPVVDMDAMTAGVPPYQPGADTDPLAKDAFDRAFGRTILPRQPTPQERLRLLLGSIET